MAFDLEREQGPPPNSEITLRGVLLELKVLGSNYPAWRVLALRRARSISDSPWISGFIMKFKTLMM